MSHDLLEDLKALHTAAIDARSGYEEARDDAEGRDTRPLFQELIAVHTKNADDLSHILQRSGAPVGEDGSFMAAVNRTVMSVRSLFGALGEGVVPALIEAEKHNLARYDDVLKSEEAPPDVREVLATNRERLEAAIDRMRALKA
ncbi:MAG: hypothetical protein JWO83_60 [Caulobacteraceae bacterium]|nr:hypothetical protein [Caulobacteraceae bacterium]